jgi:hypothetical protein
MIDEGCFCKGGCSEISRLKGQLAIDDVSTDTLPSLCSHVFKQVTYGDLKCLIFRNE